MTPPETRYAKSGDVHIAYQVSGTGPFDLVWVLGLNSPCRTEMGFSASSAFYLLAHLLFSCYPL